MALLQQFFNWRRRHSRFLRLFVFFNQIAHLFFDPPSLLFIKTARIISEAPGLRNECRDLSVLGLQRSPQLVHGVAYCLSFL